MSSMNAPQPPPRSGDLPPGPAAASFWNLLRYSHAPLSYLEECRSRFGDPFTVPLYGYGSLVMLSDPEAVRDVFRGSPSALHSGEGNEFLSVAVGTTSVLVLDGEAHAEQRRVLMPPLKGDRMRAFFTAMRTETVDRLRTWTTGRRLRLLPDLRRITLRVILRAVLGLEAGAELDEFEAKVERMSAAARTSRYTLVILALLPPRLLLGSRWVPFTRHLRNLDRALFALLERRRREASRPRQQNVLDDLIATRHGDGRPLADQEIRDAIVTLLVAGFDTTSLALAWVLEQVLRHEGTVTRIRAELAAVTGGVPLADEHLPRLDFLDATIREALRLRTIIPFVVRMTKEPFAAAGREYPSGVILAPCSHLVHRREDLYPEPERFRPQRFLDRRSAPHEWFPFGGGNRVCLGMTFALHEMKVVLATLLASVDLQLEGASRPVRQGVTLAPHDGVRVRVVRSG